jgi:hypothetical protein
MKKSILKQILTVIISCILLSISATAEEQDKLPEDLDLHGSDCIWIRTIRDYTPLSNESLLIHADDNLCPYGGDSIIFDRFAGGEARILSISRLTPDQVEMLLIRYGKKEPVDTEEDSAPPEVKGAEVEELG